MAASMLGELKLDAAQTSQAVALAQIYMLAGKGDVALEWYRLTQGTGDNAPPDALWPLWPQFALAGIRGRKRV